MAGRERSGQQPKRVDVMAEVARHLANRTWRLSYHARDNMERDDLDDADVLEILNSGKRMIGHDEFSRTYGTWNYAIHGTTTNGVDFRVVVAFHAEHMVVVNAFTL